MIVFTKHALERMKQRDITKDEVIQVLTISKEKKRNNLGHSIAQLDSNGKILNGIGPSMLVRRKRADRTV